MPQRDPQEAILQRKAEEIQLRYRQEYPEAQDPELFDIIAEDLEENAENIGPFAGVLAQYFRAKKAEVAQQAARSPYQRFIESMVAPRMPGPEEFKTEVAKRLVGAGLTGGAGMIAGPVGGALGVLLGAMIPPETEGEALQTLAGGLGGGGAIRALTKAPRLSPMAKLLGSMGIGAATGAGSLAGARAADVQFGHRSPDLPVFSLTDPWDIFATATGALAGAGAHSTIKTLEKSPFVQTKRIQEKTILRGQTPQQIKESTVDRNLTRELLAPELVTLESSIGDVKKKINFLDAEIAKAQAGVQEASVAARTQALKQKREATEAKRAFQEQLNQLEAQKLAIQGQETAQRNIVDQIRDIKRTGDFVDRLTNRLENTRYRERAAQVSGEIRKERFFQKYMRELARQEQIEPEFASEAILRSMEKEEKAIRELIRVTVAHYGEQQKMLGNPIQRFENLTDVYLQAKHTLGELKLRRHALQQEIQAYRGLAKLPAEKAEIPEILTEQQRKLELSRARQLRSEHVLNLKNLEASLEEMRKNNPSLFRLVEDSATPTELVEKLFHPDFSALDVANLREHYTKVGKEKVFRFLRDNVIAEMFRRAYDPESMTLKHLRQIMFPPSGRPEFGYDKLRALLGSSEEGENLAKFIYDLASSLPGASPVPGSMKYFITRGVTHTIYALPYMVYFHPEKLLSAQMIGAAGPVLLAASWPVILDKVAKNRRFGDQFIRAVREGKLSAAFLMANTEFTRFLLRQTTPVSPEDLAEESEIRQELEKEEQKARPQQNQAAGALLRP